MFWFELLIALVISLGLAALFVSLLGWRRPGSSSDDGATVAFLFFFFIVFLAALAGGVWIRPIGPEAWGVSWLGTLMIALVVALLLAAVTPPRRQRRIQGQPAGRPPDTGNGQAMVAAGLGAFFWILMLLLLFVTAAAYVFEPVAWRVSESTVYPPGAP